MAGRYTLTAAVACLAAAAAIASCNKDSTSPDSQTDVMGPAVTVGGGTARTVVSMDDGTPVSLGIELSASALQNLPETDSEWQLALPAGVSLAPFDHATLNWNPHGHPPPGVYMVPHFDFHFYMISEAEQHAVQGGPDNVSMAAKYIPNDYVADPVGVPNMGLHWTDTMSPEFHGSAFDRTFIYGSWHGERTFVEPMATLAFLQTHPNVEMQIKQPQAYQRGGLHPTAYGVHYDAATQTLRISLDSLVSAPAAAARTTPAMQ